MGLRALLKSGTAAMVIAAVAASPGHAVGPAPRAPLEVRYAQASDYSHIEFRWSGAAGHTMRRTGQVLTLRFTRDAHPDMAWLHNLPPRFVRAVAQRHEGGVLSIDITLAEGADARIGEADGALYVNAFAANAPPMVAPPAPPAATPAAVVAPPVGQTPRPERPNPVPADGAVHLQAASVGQQLTLQFPWRAPVGAAVFRRGNWTWIVFDAAARFDISQLPHGVASYVTAVPAQGQGWSGLRVMTRGPVAIAAEDNGGAWTVRLGPGVTNGATPIDVRRVDADGPPALSATVAGASGVYWIDDPVVGDRLAVVTALGPAKGLAGGRRYMQLNLLPSAQGLAAEPLADGLQIAFEGDLVSLSRNGGLMLSAPGAVIAARTPAHLAPATLPSLINADWTLPQATEFRPRYSQLLEALANEQASNGHPVSTAHMELARFLVGQQLNYEAIGLLNDALRRNPTIGANAEFRGLRGMANVMVRRYAEAQADFANPALANDPGAAAWRGYIAAMTGQWQDAARQFDTGRAVFGQFPPLWRGRFAQAAANAALANANNGGASAWLNMALVSGQPADEQAMTHLIQARLINAQGDQTRALAMFNALMASRNDAIAAPATLYATQIKLQRGQITPAQAAQTFDSLRFRWRGDGFELDVIRTLGQLYLSQGRYREALETFRSAGNRLPNLPQSAQLQADLSAAFRALFIDGLADGLQPVQALALWYDFRDLTPVGADGDLMVRRLVRRLVDVDLLGQAETLLAYQVQNRLTGVAQAQVATDLAVIYLMDHRPEDAINTLNANRTTLLPATMSLQRRIVAARALSGLGQFDGALEMLGADASADAQAIRAEITWRQRAWPGAGAAYEQTLGGRWSTPTTPLSIEEEGNLLRAAVAYSLAGDEAALARMRTRWTPFVAGSRNPDALRVALSGVQGGAVSAADFSRVAADNAAFEGWVNRMKVRFRQLASQPLPASSLRQAQAAPGSALSTTAAAPAAATRPATPAAPGRPAVTPAAARPPAAAPGRPAAPTRAAAAAPPRPQGNG